mmetsp:Transcript_5508/g.15816  ORF Transcript_5508/g.15816 Transcript_5508/m.15816 type:complete len:275 (-) Transcript_5508:19-843(-)
MLADHHPAFVVNGGRCHEGLHILVGVEFDDDAVGQSLFLHHQHALHAFHDEVPTRIIRALAQPLQFLPTLSVQDAQTAAQHHGHSSNIHTTSSMHTVTSPILDVDVDRGRVGEVSNPASLRRGFMDHHVLIHGWFPDVDPLVLDEPSLVGFASDCLVGFALHELGHPDLDKVVVRLYVLSHQALVLEEQVHESPLVFHGGNLVKVTPRHLERICLRRVSRVYFHGIRCMVSCCSLGKLLHLFTKRPFVFKPVPMFHQGRFSDHHHFNVRYTIGT